MRMGLSVVNHCHICARFQHAKALFGDGGTLASSAADACDWSTLGLTPSQCEPGTSTWWLGSEVRNHCVLKAWRAVLMTLAPVPRVKGAHTGAHVDTYGCNIVVQLIGHKKWILYPPSETCALRPTRIPYEESSIWCYTDFLLPDAAATGAGGAQTRYEVVLKPGDVLFVPKLYWYVHSAVPCVL